MEMVYRRAINPDFHDAAEPTLERIRRDRGRLSGPEAELLAFIEKHLLDPSLGVRLDKRVQALPDSVLQRFYRRLGRSPKAYVRVARLEVGERLLRTTRLMVWQVAAEVGYPSGKIFSAHYRRHTGKTPTETRSEGLEDDAEGCDADVTTAPATDEPGPMGLALKAFSGRLDPQSAVALVQRLRTDYPRVPRRPPSRPAMELSRLGYRHEQWLARAVWRAARELPLERLRGVMRNQVRFRSPALFRLLGDRGREIGRHDRPRGIALTEIAVECLEANAEVFGEPAHDLLTVGWSWVANQRLHGIDLHGSEEAIGFARQEWEISRKNRDKLVEAEFRLYEGTIRLYQRRFDEALDSLNRSVQVSRKNKSIELLTKALLQRVELARQVDDPKRAMKDLEEALANISGHEGAHLVLAILSSLIALNLRLGRIDEASKLLRDVKPLAGSIASPLSDAKLLWLEGLACKGRSELDSAESLLQEAKRNLLEQGETGHAAILTLDLVELYMDRGMKLRVNELLIESISMLETFKLHREVLAAIRLLRHALESDGADSVVLVNARRKLTSLKSLVIDVKS